MKRYIKREYIKKLEILSGVPIHKSCICHCLSHAFGICNFQHSEICNNCEELFQYFNLIKSKISEEFYKSLNGYLKKLIS